MLGLKEVFMTKEKEVVLTLDYASHQNITTIIVLNTYVTVENKKFEKLLHGVCILRLLK